MECFECGGYMSIARKVGRVEGILCFEWVCEGCGCSRLVLDEDGDYED